MSRAEAPPAKRLVGLWGRECNSLGLFLKKKKATSVIVTFACDVACVAGLIGQGGGAPFLLSLFLTRLPPPSPITPGRLHVKKTHDGEQG